VGDHVSVYVTCPDRDSARRIARALLERRLVACANLFPVESMYSWEGALREEAEVAMLLKTRRDRVREVVRAVGELHPYENPCVVALEIAEGARAYLAWVDGETRPFPS
jgi:periplasmic divalent cation tolerance protein